MEESKGEDEVEESKHSSSGTNVHPVSAAVTNKTRLYMNANTCRSKNILDALAELRVLVSDQLASLFRLVVVIKVHFDSLNCLHQSSTEQGSGSALSSPRGSRYILRMIDLIEVAKRLVSFLGDLRDLPLWNLASVVVDYLLLQDGRLLRQLVELNAAALKSSIRSIGYIR